MTRETKEAAIAQMLAGLMMFERTLQAESREADAFQETAGHLDIALKALEFYAEADNHKSRNGGPSAVAKDKGKRARLAFEAISGESTDDDAAE